MNWEAIGAVGEVGGAIAVVATLAYLAAQIRQSNQLERNDSHRTWVRDWNSTVLAPMLDTKFSDLVGRCVRDSDILTGAEEQAINAQLGWRVLPH